MAKGKNKGKLIVLSGPMFAGKSRYLITEFNYLQNIIKNFNSIQMSFKPSVDLRNENIESRSGVKIYSTFVKNFNEINKKINKNTKYIFVDEFQFFTKNFVQDVQWLLQKGITIYLSGLDRDFNKNYFNRYKEIKKIASQEIKLTAVCHTCGAVAKFSRRVTNSKNKEKKIMIDKVEEVQYFSSCFKCHS